jgi:hypothetical protein
VQEHAGQEEGASGKDSEWADGVWFHDRIFDLVERIPANVFNIRLDGALCYGVLP